MDTESAVESDELDTGTGDQNLDDTNTQGDTSTESGDQREEGSQEFENPLSLSDEEVMAMELPPGVQGNSDRSDSDSDDDAADDEYESATAPEDTAGADADAESGSESGDGEAPPAERDLLAEHAAIFKPFKANGQNLQLKTPEEVISLMQQGANYHQKMEKISSQMKTIKTLEKAGIDGEKLNYLIDLHNKNPQAISKLINDSEIDPMDLESDETEQYRPKDYAPSDADLALDETLEDLKSSPTFGQLIDVVGNQWDDASREHVSSNSQLLRTLNTHMTNGVYPIIQEELVRARSLGQLRGLTDLAAYQQVGAAINAQGGFNHLATQDSASPNPVQGQTPNPAQAAITLRPAQRSGDQNLNAKRRAASPTKAASTPTKGGAKPNPLAMSDEEFEKQLGSILN